ncbi:DinB family protein [Candidatus Sumerlaeota bacterium]
MQDVLTDQSLCVFDVLEETIKLIKPSDLKSGTRPRDVPARQALHIIGVFDRYSSRNYKWSARYGKSIGLFGKKCSEDEIPSKTEVLEYLSKVKNQYVKYVSSLPAGYLEKEVVVKSGRFKSNMGRYIYMIRHNTLHLGYLRSELIDRGYRLGEFK